MSKEIVTIAIDAMGGENSPQKTIEGLSIFLQKNKNQNDFFNLYGDEEKISKELDKQSIKSENLKYITLKALSLMKSRQSQQSKIQKTVACGIQ